jgi:hypothetical protein
MHFVERQLKIFMLNLEIQKKNTRFKSANNLPLDITYSHLVRVAMCISQKLNMDMKRPITKYVLKDSFFMLRPHLFSA